MKISPFRDTVSTVLGIASHRHLSNGIIIGHYEQTVVL